MSLVNLPYEVLLNVFRHLDVKSYFSLSRVCRFTHGVSKDESMDAGWYRRCLLRYRVETSYQCFEGRWRDTYRAAEDACGKLAEAASRDPRTVGESYADEIEVRRAWTIGLTFSSISERLSEFVRDNLSHEPSYRFCQETRRVVIDGRLLDRLSGLRNGLAEPSLVLILDSVCSDFLRSFYGIERESDKWWIDRATERGDLVPVSLNRKPEARTVLENYVVRNVDVDSLHRDHNKHAWETCVDIGLAEGEYDPKVRWAQTAVPLAKRRLNFAFWSPRVPDFGQQLVSTSDQIATDDIWDTVAPSDQFRDFYKEELSGMIAMRLFEKGDGSFGAVARGRLDLHLPLFLEGRTCLRTMYWIVLLYEIAARSSYDGKLVLDGKLRALLAPGNSLPFHPLGSDALMGKKEAIDRLKRLHVKPCERKADEEELQREADVVRSLIIFYVNSESIDDF